MEKQRHTKKIPFFHIYNGLSDSASFKTRLFLAFILIAVPILAVMCIGSFLVLRASTRENIQKSQMTELERVNTQLQYIINDTENMSREIIFNASVQQLLTDSRNGEQYPEDSGVAYYINGFLANRDFIDCVVLTDTAHTVFSTERAFTEVSAFDEIRQKWWYDNLLSRDTYSWYPYARLSAGAKQRESENPDSIHANSLMLSRPIYSMSDYKTQLGYMMIYLDEDYIRSIWDNVSWGNTSNLFLLDENGSILASGQNEKNYVQLLKELPVKTGSTIRKWRHTPFVLSCSNMALNKWKLCMITPYREVDSSVRVLKAQLCIMVGVIILILFLMSKYSAANMARPIILLSKIMDSYHGKDQEPDPHALRIYEKRTDEIGQMYRSYEQLEERMNKLIQEIYVKNLEKKDAELALLDAARLELLKSQINPHFLYNTLDSVNWLALANGQDEISEMITALSDTFRLSLMKNNSSFVEIDQELQYIKSYLILQKFRYADRLTYTFLIPDELPKLYIPRFILQPVVENALKHGIDSADGGGQLLIQINSSDQLVITVTNDGTDIDLEKMKNLLHFDVKETDILAFQKGGYGVQNIHRRIKIICGESYGLSYEKTDTQTICKIVLPVKHEISDMSGTM